MGGLEGRGKKRVGSEGVWLGGEDSLVPLGEDPPQGNWGQTHIWGLSSEDGPRWCHSSFWCFFPWSIVQFLPALLQKLVGELFFLFRREIWWEWDFFGPTI